MKRLRVLGIGSPFGDDRLGWLAVERLKATEPTRSGWSLEFDTLDRPGPGLLERMAGAEAVVLVDAVRHSGAEPGAVFAIDRDQLARYGDRCSSHSLGVAEVLALGEKLDALPPRLAIVGIEAGGSIDDQLKSVFDEQIRQLTR